MAKKVVVTSAQHAAAKGIIRRANGTPVRSGVVKMANAKPAGKAKRS